MNLELELRVSRRNTLAFIAARPTVVALIPVQKTKTASGGTVFTDLPPREALVMRLIQTNESNGNVPGLITAIDGRQLKVVSQLLAPYDAEMAVGDHWSDEHGKRCEIGELLPYNGYERRAQVIRYG